MGHKNLPSMIEQQLTIGQFTFSDFLQSKAEDQMSLFDDQSTLQNFMDVCDEFLHHLEKLYQSNLRALHKKYIQKHPQLSYQEQEEIFQKQFVEDFLLDTMPSTLQEILKISTPSRIHVLLDQLANFLETQVHNAGFEFFPEQNSSTQSVQERIYYLQYAGCRHKKENTYILRPSDLPESESIDVIHTNDIVTSSPIAKYEHKQTPPPQSRLSEQHTLSSHSPMFSDKLTPPPTSLSIQDESQHPEQEHTFETKIQTLAFSSNSPEKGDFFADDEEELQSKSHLPTPEKQKTQDETQEYPQKEIDSTPPEKHQPKADETLSFVSRSPELSGNPKGTKEYGPLF